MKKNILLILLLFFIIGCTNKQNNSNTNKKSIGKKYTTTFIKFSTAINISIYNFTKSEEDFNKLIINIQKIFEYFDKEMNPSLTNSTLSKLNKNCQNNSPKFVKIPQSLQQIFKDSKNYHTNFDGYFDPAIYNLVEKWGFITNHKPKILSHKEVRSTLNNIGWKNITLKNDSVSFNNKLVRVGFGAIAKGVAVDSVSNFLLNKGFKEFIINAGGDLLIKGSKNKRIGIRHPRKKTMLDTLKISNISVATSGDYEKFFIKDGKRYHHLLNPYTGMSDSDLMSVTVLSKNATTSDALATTLFVMGHVKAKQTMNKLNISGILIYQTIDGIKVLKINMD